jgi:hypothetical protein
MIYLSTYTIVSVNKNIYKIGVDGKRKFVEGNFKCKAIFIKQKQTEPYIFICEKIYTYIYTYIYIYPYIYLVMYGACIRTIYTKFICSFIWGRIE